MNRYIIFTYYLEEDHSTHNDNHLRCKIVLIATICVICVSNLSILI